MANTSLTGLSLILVGVVIMLGAALNWPIVSRSGKLLNRLLGDTLARVVYFLGGGGVFVMGIGMLIGARWAV